MQKSMHFRDIQAIRTPGRISVIVLIILGLLQTSIGYVGTSDSTIFYFGQNQNGQNGRENATGTDRILDVDVSVLRSISCGGLTTAFLYENNTLMWQGQAQGLREFGVNYPEISSVSSFPSAILYSLESSGLLYGLGLDSYDLISSTGYNFTQPQFSPPRLNEDVRFCSRETCLAFNRFPPGSITAEPVVHEPNIPLYKFVGAWGSLRFGHLGMDNTTLPPATNGMFYEGPDLIVKKAIPGHYLSLFILHNNTVVTSGSAGFIPPTDGTWDHYLPIIYNSSINATEVKIVDASAAFFHALLLSEDHRVYFFGFNDRFQSGIPGLSQSTLTTRVRQVPLDNILDSDDYVVQISAQHSRSSVITKMGLVYIWGTQLVNGTIAWDVQYIPTLEKTFLHDRYAVRYLDIDDISKATSDAFGSCVLTRPRAGNCTGEPPSADFYCIGGIWTTRGGGLNIETITISSTVEIEGDLTISGPLIINPQSSISVTECLSVGSIEIVKEQGDNTPSQGIITTGKQCPDISGTPVNVITTGDLKKCQKKTATLSKTEMGGRAVYSAIFKLNDNDCRVWWIVLVSVLGGVVLIVVVVMLIGPIRSKVLQFWSKKSP